jgi:hypothetical protein
MRSVCRRRSEPSTALVIHAALAPWPGGSPSKAPANLVPITTWSRRLPASALPMIVSDAPRVP